MEYNEEYLKDYFLAAKFFYHHGLNERLFYNLSVIKKSMDKLTNKEKGEYYFLLGMAQLRELQIDEAFQSLRIANKHGKSGEYVNAILAVQNNTLQIPIKDFVGKPLWFGRLDGYKIADVILEQNGQLLGCDHPNEKSWSFEKGVLAFRDYRNERTTLLFAAKDGQSLFGPFLNGKVMHSLRVMIDEKT